MEINAEELKDLSIYNLIYYINDNPVLVDQEIASRINYDAGTIEQQDFRDWKVSNFFGSLYRVSPSLIPETKKKINGLFVKHFENNYSEFWNGKVYYVRSFLDKDSISLLFSFWLNPFNNCAISYYNLSYFISDMNLISPELHLPILKELCEKYIKSKSPYYINMISQVFCNMNPEQIFDGFKLLSEKTPAVQACMLSRDNIPEEFVVKALKAISKLTRQTKIKATIDLEKLVHLSPKSRMLAIKQLLGLSGYYGEIRYMPFSKPITRDDLGKFLFPCMIEYGSEVEKILNRFDRYMANQERKE